MKRIRRTWGLAGVALRQLAGERGRTALAVAGVAFAVLSVTLLVGVGAGVVDTGEQLLDDSEQDLWVTGGPIELQPGTVGGVQNSVTDAHSTAEQMETNAGVQAAVPLGLQAVYVSPDGEEFDTVVGTGVPGGGPLVTLEEGDGFSANQSHYANGTYSGPMSRELIVDPATADEYDLTVGDTLYVGGTITNAQQNKFEIVGISPTFRRFVGSQTVTLRLSELQSLTGAAYDDRASLITIRTTDDAETEAVKTDLEQAYPEYTIRTNREQFAAVLERQAAVIAAGVSLVGLAVIAGTFLSLNLFLSVVYQQRREFAVFRAVGGSRYSTVGLAVAQSAVIAAMGCVLGLALSAPLSMGLDTVAAALTGFDSLVQIPPAGYLLGAGVAALFGLVGAIVGVVRISREQSVARLNQ